MKPLPLAVLALALGAGLVPAEQVQDIVDDDGSWNYSAGSFALQTGIAPTAGSSYFNFSINPGTTEPYGNRAIAKDLGIVLQAGATYTVEIDLSVGRNNRPFIGDAFSTPVSQKVAFGFFDPTGIDLGLNQNAERLKIRDAINALLLDVEGTLEWAGRAIPADGGADWQTWSYGFTLPASSEFAGRAVWFGAYGGHLGEDVQKSMAVDNLRITVEDNRRTLKLMGFPAP